MINKACYVRDTWMETSGPWAVFTRARAICPDGKARIVQLSQCADTFFSVPAQLVFRGKKISGFVTHVSGDGLSTTPEQWVVFHPTGKHSKVFLNYCKELLGLALNTPNQIAADKAAEAGNTDMEKYLRGEKDDECT